MRSESEFLNSYSPEEFDRPSVSVDVALTTIVEADMRVLLIRRPEHPFRGFWQLPGGFVRPDESLDQAARRVLSEKAGVDGVFTEQLFTFGDLNRDPRTRVISVAYYALIAADRLMTSSDRAQAARVSVDWEGETGGPAQLFDTDRPLDIAFDHDHIIGMVAKRLRGKLDYSPVGYELLPEEFTLLALQKIHETILGHDVNKDSFRRRMLASGELEPTGRRQTSVGHRPAALYRHIAGLDGHHR